MTGAGELRARHGEELRRRVAELSSALDDVGTGARSRSLAHALKGSALTLGLDVLAVSSAAVEAACVDEDLEGARRAVSVARGAAEALGSATPGADEIRGALGVITGYASLLQAATLPDEHSHAVEEILAACTRIATAIGPREDLDPSSSPAVERPAPSVRVLVVDDDLLVGEMLSDLLARAGCRVTHVVSSAAALEAITAERPDLVVLDLELGQDDGAAVLRELRRNPSLSGLRIAIVSGHQGAELEARLRALGANWVLAKPIDVVWLRTIIQGLEVSSSARDASRPG